jgi:hypothetical protein
MTQVLSTKPGFFRNLLSSFSPSFYKNVPGMPLTNAFIHIAGLSVILATILVYKFYLDYSNIILPAYTGFYTNGIPDSLILDKGRIEYNGESPYTYSAKVFDRKLGIIIDTTEGKKNIPTDFAEAILVTKNKILIGNSGKTSEKILPDKRISAKDFFIETCHPNPTEFIMQGIQLFTLFFTCAVVVAGIFAAVLFAAVGRTIPGMTFGGQLAISCFATTSLFAGTLAIHGIKNPSLQTIILITSFLIFAILSFVATFNLLRAEGAIKKQGTTK